MSPERAHGSQALWENGKTNATKLAVFVRNKGLRATNRYVYIAHTPVKCEAEAGRTDVSRVTQKIQKSENANKRFRKMQQKTNLIDLTIT